MKKSLLMLLEEEKGHFLLVNYNKRYYEKTKETDKDLAFRYKKDKKRQNKIF